MNAYLDGLPRWPKHVNPYAGGNRPPFRARLVAACGHEVELIPVLTLHSAGHPQHWQCWVPPGATLCAPFETVIEPVDGKERDLAVSVAVAFNPLTREMHAFPPDARMFTPN